MNSHNDNTVQHNTENTETLERQEPYGEYAHYDPTTGINNLSPLKRQRLEKRTIKLTKKSNQVSTKKATKLVKNSDNWSVVRDGVARVRQIVDLVAITVRHIQSLPQDLLSVVNLTQEQLKSHQGDTAFFYDKLNGVYTGGTETSLTVDNFLKFNDSMAALGGLYNDVQTVLLPIQIELQSAQAMIENHIKTTLAVSDSDKPLAEEEPSL